MTPPSVDHAPAPATWRELFPGVYTGTSSREKYELVSVAANFEKFLTAFAGPRPITRESIVDEVTAQVTAQVLAATPTRKPARRRKRSGATSAA